MIRAAVVLLLALAGTARAGICPDDYPGKIVASYEAHAKRPVKDRMILDSLCVGEVRDDAALHKRFMAACAKILARETADDCVAEAVWLGEKKIGDKDLFDLVVERFPLVTWDQLSIGIYVGLDDPRTVPVLIAAWQKGEKDRTTLAHTSDWRGWRRSAALVLAKHGGADALAFVEDELKTTKDSVVKRSLEGARAAIGKRLTP